MPHATGRVPLRKSVPVLAMAAALGLACASSSRLCRSASGAWLEDQAALAFEPLTRQGATWGMLVVGSCGEVLSRHNASTMFLPASNMKLVTTACALELFGPEHRILTLLTLDGTVRRDTAFGNLIIVGSGDPSLGSPVSPATDPLAAWRDSIDAHGIRVIAGDVRGCGDFLPQASPGEGWAWDDLGFGFAAPSAGLCFHDNAIEVKLSPGREGEEAAWIAEPGAGADHLTCSVMTASPGTPRAVRLVRADGGVAVRGVMPGDDPGVTLRVACTDPGRMAAEELRRALISGGLSVTGRAGSGCAQGGIRLASHLSPSLAELVRITNGESRNLWAEQLLRLIERDAGHDSEGAGTGGAVARTLDRLGIPKEGLLMADGCGLSRLNLASPSFMVALLWAARQRPWGEVFAASLPVAGCTGTLAERLRGTAAEGRIRAKTGSMQGVRALSGYVTTVSGDKLVFSVMINGYPGPGAVMDRAIDRFCTLLVAADP